MLNPSAANRIQELVSALLDRGYNDAASSTLRAIASFTTQGIVAQRLSELEAHVQDLTGRGQRLTPDDPVLRALIADLEQPLRRAAGRIDAAAEDIQITGADSAGNLTRQLALPGFDDAQLARLGIRWNRPDPEAINRAVGYVQSGAWADELSRFPNIVLDTVRNQALRGIAEGWSPLRSAREIRRVTEGLPAAQANTLMRTLQLTSYRDAAALHQRANAAILTEQIRIGSLDGRICMACLALHGQRLPAGQRIDDHQNGRCTSIPVVRGMTRQVTTGEQWFNSLPVERQRAIAGDGAYDLLQAGRAQLRDFVQTYEDPVYGQMVREASLRFVRGRN